MKIISLSGAPKVPFDLEGYITHSSKSLEVIHLVLQSGQTIENHSNPFDVIIYLIKGEVALNTGQNSNNLALYDMAEIEKNTERGFTNTGQTEARLLILKLF
jgi:quercetin dioxygenase-like cupin family protein